MRARVQLRRADIAAKVRRVLRGGTARPVALYGTGEAGTIEIDHVLWSIVPVRSELELRVKLADTQEDLAFVYLVDYDDRLPLDVACRLAGQKVHAVGHETRLANLFGAKSVAHGFVATALAEVLLDEAPDLPPIDGTRIGPDDAWRRYLGLRLGLKQPTVPGLLSTAFARDDDGRAFANRRDDGLWSRVLDEASAWFEQTSGAAAEVIWSAWMAGQGRALVGWLIYIDAARRAESRDAMRALRTVLRLGEKTDARWLDPSIAASLCAALDSLLRGLDHRDLRRFLAEVVGLFSDEDFDPARRFSRWLPDGFEALQDAFADALNAAMADPSALSALHAAVADFDGHHSLEIDATARQAHEVRLAGARLVTWLGWRSRHPAEHPGYADMEVLARWYDQDGAWVDWARDELRVRDTGHAAVDAALQAVAARVGALRRAYDERFARATIHWYSARKPSTDVLPIERVTHDVVARFLDGNPQRRLLIVLLDGMSVPVATRLLNDGLDGWGLVPWCPGRHRTMPPAIAALPTLTKTSRAAFFAGKASKTHGHQPESKDPSRFAANAALAPFAAAAGPRLFLKPELAGNQLPDAVVDSVNDDDERVVAVVVNAIDDQLKGSDQVDVRYESVESIPVLARLLRAANGAGRAVLLVSDHGHIPAQVMTGRPHPDGGTKGGQRWRPLRASEPLIAGEIELPEGCWTPRGANRVAVLVDETQAWGRALSGAHGGLSLAETVVPLRLIAPHWLAQHLQPTDDDLRTRDLDPPRWWTLAEPPKAREHQAPLVAKPPAEEPPDQMNLFAPPPPKAGETANQGTLVEEIVEKHPLAVALAEAPRFVAKAADQTADKREKALLFVDTLLRAKEHRMARAAFARSVGVKLRRLSGRIAYVGFLNSDGFAVIEDDTVGDQVRLHYDRLVAQYGLDP